MAVRWWKSGQLKGDEEIVEKGSTVRFDPKWKQKLVLNGFGGVLTFVVMIVFAVTTDLIDSSTDFMAPKGVAIKMTSASFAATVKSVL